MLDVPEDRDFASYYVAAGCFGTCIVLVDDCGGRLIALDGRLRGFNLERLWRRK
jgi:hypothetical protein